MKNIFKLQRICFYLFIVIMVVNFIFSLSFMTDYADLFGFELEANKIFFNEDDISLESLIRDCSNNEVFSDIEYMEAYQKSKMMLSKRN